MTKRSQVLTIFAFIFTAIAVVYIFRLGGTQNKVITNVLYLIPPAIATIIGLSTARMYGVKNAHGRSILSLSLGIGSWLIGETIWFVLRFIFNINPFPSAADFFYLIGYP